MLQKEQPSFLGKIKRKESLHLWKVSVSPQWDL